MVDKKIKRLSVLKIVVLMLLVFSIIISTLLVLKNNRKNEIDCNVSRKQASILSAKNNYRDAYNLLKDKISYCYGKIEKSEFQTGKIANTKDASIKGYAYISKLAYLSNDKKNANYLSKYVIFLAQSIPAEKRFDKYDYIVSDSYLIINGFYFNDRIIK